MAVDKGRQVEFEVLCDPLVETVPAQGVPEGDVKVRHLEALHKTGDGKGTVLIRDEDEQMLLSADGVGGDAGLLQAAHDLPVPSELRRRRFPVTRDPQQRVDGRKGRGPVRGPVREHVHGRSVLKVVSPLAKSGRSGFVIVISEAHRALTVERVVDAPERDVECVLVEEVFIEANWLGAIPRDFVSDAANASQVPRNFPKQSTKLIFLN